MVDILMASSSAAAAQWRGDHKNRKKGKCIVLINIFNYQCIALATNTVAETYLKPRMFQCFGGSQSFAVRARQMDIE